MEFLAYHHSGIIDDNVGNDLNSCQFSGTGIKKIGVVALSLPTLEPVREKRIRDAIEYLQSRGLEIDCGRSVFQKDGYKSASIETRVEDLHRFFSDAEVGMICTTTGGYNSNELLEHIDYSLVAANRKWFVGYSDNTTLNLALYAKSGLRTIAGPMLVDLLDDPNCFERLAQFIAGEQVGYCNPPKLWEWANAHPRSADTVRALPGRDFSALGTVIAGNLSTFNLMLGTPYLPSCAGAILFLEYDKEESAALPSIERMLWQIRQVGIFDQITGLVFGTLQKDVVAEETSAQNIEKILSEVLDRWRFPVLCNAQFGHVYPSWILRNGDRVEIKGSQISLDLNCSR